MNGCEAAPDSVLDSVVHCERKALACDGTSFADCSGVDVVLVVSDGWEERVVVDACASGFEFPFLVIVDEFPL